MAPRKEKSDKASADQGSAMILEYLRKQNRPYSATDISSNLHNKVTKTAAAKYLKALHERREVEERVSGKQAVYHIPQQRPPKEALDSSELADLDARISTLKSSVSTLKANEKALRAEFAQLSAFRSLDELQATVTALEIKKSTLQEQILSLRRVDVKPCSVEERDEVDRELAKWQKISKSRQRIMENIWEIYVESGMCPAESSMEEFWVEQGCEGPMPKLR